MAAFRLAELYLSGLLNPSNNVSLQRKNLSLVYKLYQKAAEEGITNANIALGYFYM